MTNRRVAIVGSRRFPSPDAVNRFVANLPADSIVVSGGAPGVDSWAEEAARQHGLGIQIFAADWDGLGRKAGPIRNAQIIAHADELVAFWDGKSRGTLNTVVQAREAGRPVRVFDTAGAPVQIELALQVAEALGVVAGIERARRPKSSA